MAYGMASISECLSGVKFPVSKQDLIAQVGQDDVWIDEGHSMKMKDFLMTCPHDMYNSVTDVTTCPDIEKKMMAA